MARRTSARLIRPGEASPDDQVSAADDTTFPLLATDELLTQVTTYLETGDADRLLDIHDLAVTLADTQGIGPDSFEVLRRERERNLGTYNSRAVRHTELSQGTEA